MLWVSTRDRAVTATFRQALLEPLPKGGGLWSPAALPRFEDWDALLDLDWPERSSLLARRLLAGEIEPEALEVAVRTALSFPVPLVPIAEGLAACELFHGPTLAFKDVGARFFAALLDLVREPGQRITILTATSGDTGAAVAHAFWNRPGVRVVVLYPEGRISELQELQLTTLGGNVAALSVAGSFDDCQALAKGAFADAGLHRRHGLTSANSINVARLLPQTFYYAEIVSRHRKSGDPRRPLLAVPSGNFGNLCAGLMARAMGLPLARWVAATNANTTICDYLESGSYRPRPSVPTLSNAMDVGDPSNWERVEALFGGDLEALRAALRWGWKSDGETEEAIRSLAARGYLADPHGAVAAAVLADHLRPDETGIFLATAHPAKFLPVFAALGLEVAVPPALAALRTRGTPPRRLEGGAAGLLRVLEEGCRRPAARL
jgi:threonine synthase